MTFSPRVIWRNNKLFCLMIFLLLASIGSARAEAGLGSFVKETVGLSGSVRAGVFNRDKSFSSDRYYSVNSVWLQARPAPIYGVTPFLDARGQDQNSTRLLKPSADLREAYLEASFGPLDLKLGRQIVVWGRADKANPTDVWSTKDFTLLTTDDEDQRTGSGAVQAAWNIGNGRVIALWQPEWREPVFPLAPLPNGSSLRYGSPKGRAGQFGLKYDTSGDAIDWSLSYSRVIDRNPDLKVLSANGNRAELEFNFQKNHVFGADFAKTIDEYGLRGEAAYVRTPDTRGEDRLAKNPYFYGVFGIERSFGDLNINAQYVYRHIFHFRSANELSDPNQRYLAGQIEVLNNQKSQNFHAGTLRVNQKFYHDTLEAELALAGWFNNGLIRPKISYAFTDSIRGIVGAELYRGSQDSFFGRLQAVSSGFAETRVLF